MLYRALADAVVIVHLGFILFVAVGPVLAWRWPRLVWLHAPALAWSAAAVTVGIPCPLTALEKGLRDLAGTGSYDGGFVDRYIENVVYPDEYTNLLRALVAVTVVVGYGVLATRAKLGRRWRRPSLLCPEVLQAGLDSSRLAVPDGSPLITPTVEEELIQSRMVIQEWSP